AGLDRSLFVVGYLAARCGSRDRCRVSAGPSSASHVAALCAPGSCLPRRAVDALHRGQRPAPGHGVSARIRPRRNRRPVAGQPLAPVSDTVARTAWTLWETCRPQPSARAIRALAAGGIDPARAATAALEQGVAALLWRALELAGCTGALRESGEAVQAEAELLRFQAALFLPSAVAQAVKPLVDVG